MSDTRTTFSVVFDSTNPNWTADSTHRKLFLRSVQNYMNNRLIKYGYVFLNEVHDALGFPRTSKGQTHGWFWEEGSKTVDFIITEREHGLVEIEFDPDGEIYQRLP